MTLNFTFLSEDQIWGDNALEVLKRYGTKVEPTDLVLILGGEVDSISEDKPGCTSWSISSCDYKTHVRVVDYNGNGYRANPIFRSPAARPSLSPTEASKISPSKAKAIDGIRIVEYGVYPQTVADKHTSEKLEELRTSGSLPPTGKSYTFDSHNEASNFGEDFKGVYHQEYEMDGKRYIRISARPGCHGKLSTGEQVKAGKDYWVEVQPIKWLVDKNGTMVTKKSLFAGIPFDKKEIYDGRFSKTFMKHYLDTYFAKEIEQTGRFDARMYDYNFVKLMGHYNTTYLPQDVEFVERVTGQTKKKKGLISLLSEQERREIEEDRDVSAFREAREALIEKKLEGTEKLSGKEKRKAELAILQKTNVQVLRDAEGKARAKKMAGILKGKQSTK